MPDALAKPQPLPVGAGIDVGIAIVGFVLCFLVGAGIVWSIDVRHAHAAAAAADRAARDDWSDDESPIPVSSKDPMWGDRFAPVTIVQFSDFQCPYCTKVLPSIERLKAAYGPDKLRIFWKNRPLPFHPNAKPAAEAAMGVFALKGSDAFWKFHDAAFKNQSSLSAASYETWAEAAGVDMAKWKAGIAAHTWASKVLSDDAIATEVAVNSAPAAFINGVLVSGAQQYERFNAIVDQELRKAEAKLALGTPRDKLYVVMTKENKANAVVDKDEQPERKEDTTTVYKVPVGDSPVSGPNTAQVTIIEFSDFQCPYCSRVEPTLKAIRDKYGDMVRFVWKNEPMPFHPRAEPAAEVALEARAEKGDKAFWDVHDRLFAAQAKLEDADLFKVATDAGLDLEKVKGAMKTHKYRGIIDADTDLSDDMQAAGTPHFFVNGRRLGGAQPIERFSEIIDDELKKTKNLLAKGVVPAALYDALIKDGKGAPEMPKRAMVVPPNAPSRGNPKAKVTVVEFSDFQCPFCVRSEESVNQVMKNYGDKINFVWRNLPLPMHPDAPLAAEASMEAFSQRGSSGFWKMHDLLYANQPDQKRAKGLQREALDAYATQLGLNMHKWKAALDGQIHKPEVDADAKAGRDIGIDGAPAFLINGYFVDGLMPYAKFRKLIDRALAEAK